jgi:hypothetical protein
MTTLTQETFTLPLVPDGPAANDEETRTSDGRRPTLGRKLELTWEGLRASGVAACPLCGGRMERRAAHARCGCCGTRLS